MVVELDGKIHELQKEHDQAREYVLKSLGLKVVRFTNEEIEDDLDAVVEVIRGQLAVRTPSLVREGAGG
jgi:very-short-patch-repair endonuclease